MTDVVAGRFALCDPIARGGSGTVWRAWDRKRQMFCAAKVLRRRDAGDLLRFVREQSFRMSHDHVLTPYSWAAEDAHVVIASELVDGGSLTTLLDDHGPLAATTVATVLDQLLHALEEIHAAGLVHRDVKPANLLLRATGTGPIQVMLGDFGLAIGAEDAHLTQAGTVVGTPGYLAPEILRGDVSPEPRHDLYAAGRVAAALASGVEPSQVGAPTELAAFAPGPLRDVVAALAAADVARRPLDATQARAWLAAAPRDAAARTRDGDAIDLRHRLPPLSDVALAEAGGPSDTARFRTGPDTVTGSPEPHGRRPRRRRGRLAAAAAALAVVATAGVVLPLSLGGDDGRGGAPRPRPSSTPTVTTGGTYTAPPVSVDEICSFTDEGDRRRTGDGTAVSCEPTGDGTYVWTRT